LRSPLQSFFWAASWEVGQFFAAKVWINFPQGVPLIPWEQMAYGASNYKLAIANARRRTWIHQPRAGSRKWGNKIEDNAKRGAKPNPED